MDGSDHSKDEPDVGRGSGIPGARYRVAGIADDRMVRRFSGRRDRGCQQSDLMTAR